MPSLGRHTFWRTLRKRFAASIALLAYLAASSNLPLPAAPAPKDRSRPYPCMDNPCGCSCAEDCWRHCCCTTPEERWAWAAAHNVTPPDYAERPGAHSQGACPRCHADPAGPRSGPGLSPLYCKGLTTFWATAATSPVPATFAWRPAVVLADRLAPADHFASRLSRTPPSPPPR